MREIAIVCTLLIMGCAETNAKPPLEGYAGLKLGMSYKDALAVTGRALFDPTEMGECEVLPRFAIANASISWDCIAFVQTTIVTTATVKIEYSNDGTFAAGVTTIGPITVPITSVNSSRAKCHIHELPAPAPRATPRFLKGF